MFDKLKSTGDIQINPGDKITFYNFQEYEIGVTIVTEVRGNIINCKDVDGAEQNFKKKTLNLKIAS